ncbi:transcriptional regulator [Azospirillum thiophilum]|uniref:Transcriptional regulator n=1 Tax=Azospirillum thiophilum TaxID=528244 RepID=A0AAC8VYJ4_9PROT|nr:TfoX/Sxy family protein [Azospirillum thiophilum]ALG71839.1 transcriptional regulator [Azospirillum thiophilum]KJR66752.1 transcriptional regulator [Azospirillum thiophilum]
MPPRPPSEYVVTLCEMMAPLGDVRARRMFGGYGLSIDGLTFALVADETLYLKADEVNRGSFTALGLAPFRPMPDKPVTLSYYPPPDQALDDRDELLPWARSGFEAALRAAAKKTAKPERKKSPAGQRG